MVTAEAVQQLKAFQGRIEASPYFDDADRELVRDTIIRYERKLELTSTLSDVIHHRQTALMEFPQLAETFREMIMKFAQRQVQMERMRDAAMEST